VRRRGEVGHTCGRRITSAHVRKGRTCESVVQLVHLSVITIWTSRTQVYTCAQKGTSPHVWKGSTGPHMWNFMGMYNMYVPLMSVGHTCGSCNRFVDWKLS
jgi:hypothetical protein